MERGRSSSVVVLTFYTVSKYMRFHGINSVEGWVKEKSRENDSRLYSTWQIVLAGEEAGGEKILDLSTIYFLFFCSTPFL